MGEGLVKLAGETRVVSFTRGDGNPREQHYGKRALISLLGLGGTGKDTAEA